MKFIPSDAPPNQRIYDFAMNNTVYLGKLAVVYNQIDRCYSGSTYSVDTTDSEISMVEFIKYFLSSYNFIIQPASFEFPQGNVFSDQTKRTTAYVDFLTDEWTFSCWLNLGNGATRLFTITVNFERLLTFYNKKFMIQSIQRQVGNFSINLIELGNTGDFQPFFAIYDGTNFKNSTSNSAFSTIVFLHYLTLN